VRGNAVVVIAVLLSGCADTHSLVRTAGTGVQKLDPTRTVYVSVSEDGRYGSANYPGSGQMAAQIVAGAFSKLALRVQTGVGAEPLERTMESAKKVGATYLVVPTILHWEHRRTEWSGIPNQSSIKISVVDVVSGQTLDGAVITAKSGLATFGGDTPQGLLPEPVEKFVSSLY
jgi:hypothetical protein